jgi:hypothetical protein
MRDASSWIQERGSRVPKEGAMSNIFYVIGVVVVVLFILGYFGFR